MYVDEKTPPCGMPVLNWHCMAVWFLYVVYALRPLVLFAVNFIIVLECWSVAAF